MSKQRETLDLDPNTRGAAFVDDDREPEINADFSRTVVIDTHLMDWQASPAAGVWRKRLELIGRNNPRLTSTVRPAACPAELAGRASMAGPRPMVVHELTEWVRDVRTSAPLFTREQLGPRRRPRESASR